MKRKRESIKREKCDKGKTEREKEKESEREERGSQNVLRKSDFCIECGLATVK